MTRTVTASTATGLDQAHLVWLVFVELQFASGTVRFTNAGHTLEWDGESWLGLGQLVSIDGIEDGGGLQARGVAMRLSGVDAENIAISLQENYQGRTARMWLAVVGRMEVQAGTAQAGSEDTLTLANAASSTDGAYNGKLLVLGDARERRIVGYVGATRVATVEERWQINLVQYSEQLDNAYWSSVNLTAINANAVPLYDGRIVADELVEDSSVGVGHLVSRQWVPPGVSEDLCGSVYVRRGVGSRNAAVLLRQTIAAVVYDVWVNVDLSTGTIVSSALTSANWTNEAGGVEDMGGGWYRIWVAGTTTGTATAMQIHVRLGSGTSVSYTGDGVSSIYAAGMQVDRGLTPGDYVATTSAALDTPDNTATYTVTDEAGIIADPVGPWTFRMDTMGGSIGQEAYVTLTAERRLADWDRRRARRYNDADQQSEYPGDVGMQYVESLQDKEIVWGNWSSTGRGDPLRTGTPLPVATPQPPPRTYGGGQTAPSVPIQGGRN
jgi:hypothetical protein